MLLSGILLHQGLLRLATFPKTPVGNRLRGLLVSEFILLGALCLLLTPLNPRMEIYYHGRLRWIGIYASPNEFGLMMAVIFVLAAGRGWSYKRERRIGLTVVYSLLAVLSAICVIKSYSREAWISILAGCLFFLWANWKGRFSMIRDSKPFVSIKSRWAQKALWWGVAGILIGFASAYAIKRASQSKTVVVQRVFSAFNRADFSSRNRLDSYQDGINMLLDHPLAGYGWQDVIAIHSGLYLQPGLYDGSALRLNDFLMFALRFGLPTLMIFALFAWYWLLARPKAEPQSWNNDIVLCRTAVLMFAVGFIFSDGLCRLATGGGCWVFLTLAMDFDSVSWPRLATSSRTEATSTIPNK